MNVSSTIVLIFLLALFTSCDLRSGTARKEMEKWEDKPAEPRAPVASASPVDPTDIVEADVAQQGEPISVIGVKERVNGTCSKFNQLMVNGDDNTVAIKGVCKQIMVNGDRNTITADAAAEFVFNGTENVVTYSRVVNGRWPSMVQNQAGNVIEKVSRPIDKK